MLHVQVFQIYHTEQVAGMQRADINARLGKWSCKAAAAAANDDDDTETQNVECITSMMTILAQRWTIVSDDPEKWHWRAPSLC